MGKYFFKSSPTWILPLAVCIFLSFPILIVGVYSMVAYKLTLVSLILVSFSCLLKSFTFFENRLRISYPILTLLFPKLVETIDYCNVEKVVVYFKGAKSLPEICIIKKGTNQRGFFRRVFYLSKYSFIELSTKNIKYLLSELKNKDIEIELQVNDYFEKKIQP